MRFIKIVLLAAALGSLFLTACGESPNDGQPQGREAASGDAAAGEAAPVQGPVDGDMLVGATIGEASNLIPALASDSASMEVISLVYSGLVKFDQNLNIVGDLAESWDISEDGLTITFHLRPNVRWHDGEPLTARDALFTYEIMVDPQTPTAYGENFKQIEKAEAIDDLTFRVTYKRPLAKALMTWGFQLMPAHLLKGQNLDDSPLARRPVGTGPYKMADWEAGQRIVLEANDDYFLGRPHLDRLVTRVIPDLNAQFMELSAGAIDQMGLTPDQYEEVLHNTDFQESYNLFRYPDFSYTYLGFNFLDPRFQDKRVRQAIAYAIDKQELVDGVLLGLGTPANGPFKPDMWANNQNVKPYPFDPDKARALLAEAGWADSDQDGVLDQNGQPFQFTILTNQGHRVREQTGLIIQARLAQVGIKVNLRILEWAALLKEYIDQQKFEAVIMAWTVPQEPDLFDVWHSSKTHPGELNFISYKNPEVDRLIDQGRFNLDLSTRKAAYDRIQEIFYEEAPYVFLFVPDSLPVISSRVIGPAVSPAGIGYNQTDWYVPQDKQVYQP